MAFDQPTAYKAWSDSTAATATLCKAIEAVQHEVESFLGMDAGGLESQTFTELYDGTDHDTLRLTHYPVTSLTSVSRRTGKTAYSALTATTYDVTARGEVYLVNALVSDFDDSTSVFERGRLNWQVVYVAGYTVSGASENRPKDLLRVFREMVSDVMRSRDSDTDGSLTSENMGSYSYSLDAESANRALTPERMSVLAAYKRGAP